MAGPKVKLCGLKQRVNVEQESVSDILQHSVKIAEQSSGKEKEHLGQIADTCPQACPKVAPQVAPWAAPRAAPRAAPAWILNPRYPRNVQVYCCMFPAKHDRLT